MIFKASMLYRCFTLYIAIALIALYQEYQLVIATTLLISLSFTYGDNIIGSFNNPSGLINIGMSIIMFAFVVSTSCRSSKKLWDDSMKEKKEKELSAEKCNEMLDLLSESIEKLTLIESSLLDGIENTEAISSEVNMNFQEIGQFTSEQDCDLGSISQDVLEQTDEINSVVEENEFVSKFTDKTFVIATHVDGKLTDLERMMSEVNTNSDEVVISINEFMEYVKNINDILTSIN